MVRSRSPRRGAASSCASRWRAVAASWSRCRPRRPTRSATPSSRPPADSPMLRPAPAASAGAEPRPSPCPARPVDAGCPAAAAAAPPGAAAHARHLPAAAGSAGRPAAGAAGPTAAAGPSAGGMTGAADPRDLAPQRVLPLVVRIERQDPPIRTDALEAAAIALLSLLADRRAAPGPAAAEDGEWARAVREWTDGRIRKVARRARGAEWRRAEALDGITVTRRTAQIRVFPPVPLDGWPRDLARLQVGGTDLDDPEPPPEPPPGTAVLWLNPALRLSAGKAMAQVGHAAQLGWNALDPWQREAWRDAGFALAVRTAREDRWKQLLAAGLPLVRDAGFTEVEPGTCTSVADL